MQIANSYAVCPATITIPILMLKWYCHIIKYNISPNSSAAALRKATDGLKRI